MGSHESDRLWKAFYDAARHNDVLDTKTTLLLHLGAAMALGCVP